MDSKSQSTSQFDNTFNLSVPFLTPRLQQGDTIETKIGIKRQRYFDQDVVISFSDVPNGITITPESSTIVHGDTDIKLTVKATDETGVGDYKIKINGHPTEGVDSQVDFKIAIAPKVAPLVVGR